MLLSQTTTQLFKEAKQNLFCFICWFLEMESLSYFYYNSIKVCLLFV